MKPAPLPPHERNWRHPSELAANERDLTRLATPPAGTRALAVVTGAVGLVVIGALVLTVSPRRPASPVAVSATTTFTDYGSALDATMSIRRRSALSMPLRQTRHALATPIGSSGLAMMTTTAAALGSQNGPRFDVQLSTGAVVAAEIVEERIDDGIVVVTIALDEPGHEIADDIPAPDEIVTVLADPPVTVPYAAVPGLDARDGTPVLDADGDLVGLCTRNDDGGQLVIDVTGEHDGVSPTESTVPTSTDPASDDATLSEPSVAATSDGP